MGSFDPAYLGNRSGNYRDKYDLSSFGFSTPAGLQAEALKFGATPNEYLTSQARVRDGVLLSPGDVSSLLSGNYLDAFDQSGTTPTTTTTPPADISQVVVASDDDGGKPMYDANFTGTALPSDWQSAVTGNPLWDLTKYGNRPNYALGKMASNFGPNGGGDSVAQGLINALVLPGLRDDISVGDMTPGLGGVGRDQLYDWFKYDFLPYMQGDDLYSAGSYDPFGQGVEAAGKGVLLGTPEAAMDFGMSRFDGLPLSLNPDLTADILGKLNLSIGADDINFDAAGVGSDLLSKIGIMPVGMSEGGGPGFSLAPGVGRDLAEALNLQIGEDFTISPETANIITGALQDIIPKSEDLFSEIINNTPGADILNPLTNKITDVGGELDLLGDQAGDTLTSILEKMGRVGEFTLPDSISNTDSMVSSLYRNLFGGDGQSGIQNFQPGSGLQSLLPGGDIGLGASTVTDLLSEIEGFNTTGISQGLRGLDIQSQGLLDNINKASGSFTDPGGLDALMRGGQNQADALRNTLQDASDIKIDLPSLGELPGQIDKLSTDIPGVEQQLRSLINAGKADEGIISAISNLMSGQMPTASDISTIVSAVNQGLQLPDEAMGRLEEAIDLAGQRVGDIEPPDLEQVTSGQILGALDMPDADAIMGSFPGLTDAMSQLQGDISNLQPSIDTGIIDTEIRDIGNRISNLQPSIDTGIADTQIQDMANRISGLDVPSQAQLLGAMDLPSQAQLLGALDMPDQTALLGALDLPSQQTLLSNMAMPNTDMLLDALNMPSGDAMLGALDMGGLNSAITSMGEGVGGLGDSITDLTGRLDATGLDIEDALGQGFWENLSSALEGRLGADDLAGLEGRLGKLIADGGGGGGGSGDGVGEGGGATGGTDSTLTGTAGWLAELQEQIRAGFGRDPSEFGTDENPQTYAEYLREDPITASLIADYGADADDAESQLREDMNRMGLLGGGGNTGSTDMGNVFGDFLAASKRGEAGLVSDAATRAQDLRGKSMDRGSTLSDIMSRRDIGIGELMGELGGDRTLGGREADMDVIAAAVAALDPNLKLGTGEGAQENKELFQMLITQLDLPPETVKALGKIVGFTPSGSYEWPKRPDGTPREE